MPKVAGRDDVRRQVVAAGARFARCGHDVGTCGLDGLPFQDAAFDDALRDAMPELGRRLGDALHDYLDALQDAAAAEVVRATSDRGRIRIDSRLFVMPVSGPAGSVRDMLVGDGLRDLAESLTKFGFAHPEAHVALTTLAMPLPALARVGPGRLRRALWAAAGEIVPGLQRDEARSSSAVLEVSDDPFETLPAEGRVMRVIVGVRVLVSRGGSPLPADYLTTNGFPDDGAWDDADDAPRPPGADESAWLAWADRTFREAGVSFGGPQSWFEAERVASVDAIVDGLEGEADLLGIPPGARNGTFHFARDHRRLLVGLRLPDGRALGPVEVPVRAALGGDQVMDDLMAGSRDAAVPHDDASGLVGALTAPLPPAVPPRVPRKVRVLQLPTATH